MGGRAEAAARGVRLAAIPLLLALAACGRPQEATAPQPPREAAPALAAKPVEPPAPGTPGGLPDNRTPVSEAPFSATSAQGAADVVQTYYALLESGRTAEAGRLRGDGRPPDLSGYSEYHAQVGAPGGIEGAAGSLYVEVPVVIYGRLKTGAEVHETGKAILRRVNDVPGSTAVQRRWRIERIELSRPSGGR